MTLAATVVQGFAQTPNLHHVFLISLGSLVVVVVFATAIVVILLRRSYARRLEEERLATIGTVTARILHQLKNPLQSLILQAELLQDFERTGTAELRREASDAVLGEAQRISTMLGELSVWASGSRRSLELAPTPLHELVADFARRVAFEADRAGIRFAARIRAEVVADVDPYFLQQALENLTRNAQEALRGRDDARLEVELDGTPSSARIRIVDNGPGIPAERLDRVFDPFVSGKSNGMGLGLTICRDIVEAQGGTLEVRSTPGTETVFSVTLPLSNGAGDR